MFRKIRCWLQMCPFKAESDSTGCWGQCVDCGKRSGFVSRETFNRLMDAELAERKRN